ADETQFDLQSTLVHEITHGLGILSLTGPAGTSDIEPNIYSKWDEKMECGNGDNMFTGDPPSFAGVASDFVITNLFSEGANDTTVYDRGGVRPGIYAPESFEWGSSLSNWDTGNIVGGAVMEHVQVKGVTRRNYADFEIAALLDIGWTNAAVPGGG